MKCHGLSCDVMVRMRGPDVRWPVRAWRCHVGRGRRVFRSVSPASRLRHGSVLSSNFVLRFPSTANPSGGTLFRAYRAPACAPVGVGAVRAPDCACARGAKRRAQLSCPFLSGFFSRRREPGEGTAPGMPLPSCRLISARYFGSQFNLGIFYQQSNKPVLRLDSTDEPAILAAMGFSPDRGRLSEDELARSEGARADAEGAATPPDAPDRWSIEVRCVVLYG